VNTDTLFRYVGLGNLGDLGFLPPPPETEIDMAPQQDEDLKTMLREYLHDTGGERRQIKEMFDKVMTAVSNLRGHVDDQIASVRADVKGVEARVTIIEADRRKTPSKAPQAIATYQKTDTGTYRLTDFELHDLHAEAQTWKGIKSFARTALIPVVAALILGLLAFIGASVWHPRIAAPSTPTWQAHP
jgi:hypothetical protein